MAEKTVPTHLFALKNLWKLRHKQERQELVDAMSDDCTHPISRYERFAEEKSHWMCMSGRDREAWRQWVDSQ